MRPLSVFAFIKGSIRKILPMVVTVCLAVAILYFLSMFMEQLDGQVNEASTYPLKNMSFIIGSKSGITDSDIQKLESKGSNTQSFIVDIRDVTYYSVAGYTGANLIMARQKDISSIMELQKLSLSGGRFPQKPMEVLLHKKLAANYGLKVGSVVVKKTKGWYINEDITVVGLFDGKGVMGIGMEDESRLKPGMPNTSIAVGGDSKSLETVNRYIEKTFAAKYRLFTLDMVEKILNNFNGPINVMRLFVGIVLVCVLGVFLTNITMIQYSLRRKELELLHAIGYTREYIIFKAFREIGVAGIIGYLSGIVLTILLIWGINVCFLTEKGLDMPLLSPGTMITLLLVPAAITLFSMLAPLRMTKFRDIV